MTCRGLSLVLAVLVVFAASVAAAQKLVIPRKHDRPPGPALSPQDAVARMTVPDGFTVDIVAAIIERERPGALLPTIGGQTGLNLAIELAEQGVLDRFGVELIGAKIDAIKKAEDRDLFKHAMQRIGLAVPRSGVAHSMDEARALRREIGLPLIIRPSRTLGGTGATTYTLPVSVSLVVRSRTTAPFFRSVNRPA